MISTFKSSAGLKVFSVDVDEYAGVITVSTSKRCFTEPMTFRYVKDCMVSIESDYTDNSLQEIVIAGYKEQFSGFNIEKVQCRNQTISLVIPEKKTIEKHMLFWNLDFEEGCRIFIGKGFIEVQLGNSNQVDSIYRDGVLDVYLFENVLIGFRINSLKDTELRWVQERISINQQGGTYDF